MEQQQRYGAERSKVIRLVEYLIRIASLRTKTTRDLSEYPKILWIEDIPRQKGCFTQAWGRDEDVDSEVWIEIQARREPELPGVPTLCKAWADQSSLRNKSELPVLSPEITRQVERSAGDEISGVPEFGTYVENLADYPEVQQEWDRYIEDRWLPWTEEHSAWERVHKVYSEIFAIHQEQLRLGEEYELVLGLGLLTWQTPTGQQIRRHLIVANALLEFEARLGKFTIRPVPDGADVRPELDMLDVEEQPARVEEMANHLLINAADDPWEEDCIGGVLQALVHSIDSQGEYRMTLEAKNKPHAKPVVEYAPALILRKRSAKGLNEALKRIKGRIEGGEHVPGEFGDLAEMPSQGNADSEHAPSGAGGRFDGEVFFPKPWNEEQLRIVDKIRRESGVLVQGPPGTGKSHTIANLICHLLATGQRILITAKTPRALQVLEGLVPEELRPLCISLLGSGLEEKRSLESSVGGILRKNEEWNEKQTDSQREELHHRLHRLREEKAEIDRRLRDIRESETHARSVVAGYCGTAARIVQAMNRDRDCYEWFADTVPLGSTCPISEGQLRSLLMALRRFTSERRQELSLVWPDALPATEWIAKIVNDEKRSIEDEKRWAKGADGKIADLVSQMDFATIEAVRDSLFAFQCEYRRLSVSTHAWMQDALRDVICGNSSLWRQLMRITKDAIHSMEALAAAADDTAVEFPDGANVRPLLEDVQKLKKHIENGGKLGWAFFRPRPVKECVHILKTVRVNGRPCSNLEQLSLLANALHVRVECERVWGFWVGRCEEVQGPYTLQLHAIKSLCETLGNVLSVEALLGKCRELLRQIPSLDAPAWIDDSHAERLITSCRVALATRARRIAVEEIRGIEARVVHLVAKGNAHPVASELLQAIHARDIDGFVDAVSKIQNLERDHQDLRKVDEDIESLRFLLPRLAGELERTCNNACWEARIQQVQGAWRWAQARFWVEEYIRDEDTPALARRTRQIEDEISGAIAKLASLYAWSFCFSRLKESHRRHMEAWKQSMRRIGKGTGKYVLRYRREAQQHLNECREAVPAWVMPLHRVWDTVDPAPGMFDVVIVDEASQCGVEALPLLYLGKRILIVGDDKQISPDAVGLHRSAVHRLMEELLHDFQFKSSFDIESSLFDHGKLRYGTRRITLREHFRCMPEIIRFSNDLCYSDTPLVPLRQYGPDRLVPLQHVFLERGYREGSNNRVVNQPEAEAIVEKITGLCEDPRYVKKTMGVIVLQGEAQADLIESLLLERLGAEEIEQRRLVCGNPYSFQGDERDIIFLSMVAAPNERVGALTKPADERRFNVAASRARDQMYLFHSVTREDLSTSCLRRRLLEFFEEVVRREIAGLNLDELERRALQENRSVVNPPLPFESWFEIDVALEVVRKGFMVIPQYEVAGKRIDLVVEGGHARLAVECDGDEWHGADRYEADMQRQRQLERCGWEFFRVRESAFYSHKGDALQGLWRALEERGIFARAWGSHEGREHDASEQELCEQDCDEVEDDGEDDAVDDFEDMHLSGRRAEEVTVSEIQDAILRALSKCPNQSCTLHSITARVLKELGVRTRGNPRVEFEKRVMRSLGALERRELVEKYKAKNKRIRLLD